jgi:hypothetical protein
MMQAVQVIGVVGIGLHTHQVLRDKMDRVFVDEAGDLALAHLILGDC